MRIQVKMKTEDKDIMSLILAKLDKMDDKIDKIEDNLHNVDKTLVKQEANLQEHMRRTDLLEASQNDLRDVVKPLTKIYTVGWGIGKIIISLGVAIAVIEGIIKLLNH